MIDLFTGVAIVNSLLAFAGVVLTVYGQYYFREGLLVRTFRRGTLVALLLFLHFIVEALGDLGVIAHMPQVGEVLEFAFTLALAYLSYGLIKDWQKIT